MAPEREDWPRLADYVISARVAAGYKDRRAFAAATGVTERTLGNLERGTRVAPETLAVVESVLHWKPGSARSVLGGGDPVPLGEPPHTPAPEPRFADPRLQYVMDTPGLDLETRLLLVDLTRAIIARREAQNHRSA